MSTRGAMRSTSNAGSWRIETPARPPGEAARPCLQRSPCGTHTRRVTNRPGPAMPHTNVGTSQALLDELATWVAMETPTTDPAAVNRLMDLAEGELARAGAALTRIPGRDGFGDNLIARTPGNGKPVLVAGHLDTVWSVGTLDGMPYQVNGGKAHGPGIYDMKAGSFLAFHAVRSILQQRVRTRRPIVLLLTPDEEVGSPTSREWIEREADQAACVLIPEPAGH